MKNILLAVDGSKYSEKAVDQGLELAEKFDAKVTFLNVVSSYGYAGEILEEAIENEVSSAKELLSEFEEKAEEHDIKVEREVIKDSSAANGIVGYAKEHEFDLIVVGARGKSGLETIQLGSVSEAVVKRSETPVLVYR